MLPHSNRPPGLQLGINDGCPEQPAVDNKDRVTGQEEGANGLVKLARATPRASDRRDKLPSLVVYERRPGGRDDPEPLAFVPQHGGRPVEQKAGTNGIPYRGHRPEDDGALRAGQSIRNQGSALGWRGRGP